MKCFVLLLLPVAAAGLAADADDRGPGITGQRQGDALVYAASGFDAIGLGGAASVDVRVGPGYSVRAVGPAAAFANFRVVQKNGTLEIGQRYRNRQEQTDLERRITVYVTMPRLASASIGGSGKLTADRVEGNSFDGAVGGSGAMRIATLKVDHAKVSIGGSGDVAAAGSARALDVSIGGSGSFTGPAFHARSARISSAGSGSVRASVDGPATVSMVGGGDIDLGPAARCTTTRMGGGKVRCG